MRRFRHIIVVLLLLMPLSARADFLAWLNKIDYLLAEDSHSVSRVWSGHFKALNGDEYNMAQFYAPKKPQFNLRAAIALKETPRLRLSMPLHYDHGYRAALYEATPYIGIGFIGQWAARDNVVLGLHIHDGLQAGGDITERPCHDGFRRAFHCGTGLPWSDAAPLLDDQEIKASGRITLNWRF